MKGYGAVQSDERMKKELILMSR